MLFTHLFEFGARLRELSKDNITKSFLCIIRHTYSADSIVDFNPFVLLRETTAWVYRIKEGK